MAEYEVIASRCSGDEPIQSPDGAKIGTLHDYWCWAHSDLIGNAERGKLAEYLVACALGIQNEGIRTEWDKYDLELNDGSKTYGIEVKSSGYLQAWKQTKPSAINFGIQQTYGWDSKTAKYSSELRRQADVYVFCVHKEQNPNKANPLELSQWDFYLLPTRVLDEKVPRQKRITLSALLKLGAEKVPFERIKERLLALV